MDSTRTALPALLSIALTLPIPGWSDTTPAPFTFPSFTDAEPGDLFVQDLVVTEIDEPTAISVTGGEYRIVDGAFTTSPGIVHDTQQVQVRATAGPFGETVDLVLDIGGVQGTLSVTTRPANSDSVLDSNGNPVLVSTSAGTLMNLAQAATPAFAPSPYRYNHGFFEFDITDLTPGAEVTATMTLPVGAAPTYYITCTVTSCTLFPRAFFAGRVVGLVLVDGGSGDNDNLANGTISARGAPATLGPYNGPHDGGAMGWVSLAVLLAACRKPRVIGARKR